MEDVNFITTVTTAENVVSPAALAGRLRITKIELAASLGLSRDAVSKQARSDAQKTQSRLRDMVEIMNRVLPWTGNELAAFAWYRSQPLPSFGDKTAKDLVGEGRGEAVKAYLSRITEGGYA
ncbi:MAG: antitoxin Xre/MbcA/ParS toxin-binding domain-containing protein [Pseudomonadales bacterium]